MRPERATDYLLNTPSGAVMIGVEGFTDTGSFDATTENTICPTTWPPATILRTKSLPVLVPEEGAVSTTWHPVADGF